MANTVSRLKSTDSLAQWADKVNTLMDSVDSFTQTSGSITTTSPATKDLAVYNSGWKNYALTGDITLNLSGSTLTTKIEDTFISGKTDLGAGVASASDYILIFDASEVSGSRIKKTLVSNIQTTVSVAGSDKQIQFNDGGSFGGATGVIYTKGTNTFKAYGPVETGAITVSGTASVTGNLTVDTNVLYVDTTNNRIGVNNTPSYPLDVTGVINTSSTYNINGNIVLSSTALGSGITSSSLTTIGTLSTLNVSGSASVNSLTVTNNIAVNGAATTSTFAGNVGITGTLNVTGLITGSISGNAGTVTNGVYTTGDQTIGGNKTFSNTISGNITGTASINTPSASMSTITGTQSVVAGGVYSINITTSSQTLTLPTSPATGSKISFYPISSSITTYTIARGGTNTIMGLSENLVVDLKVPFDLLYNGTTWVLA